MTRWHPGAELPSSRPSSNRSRPSRLRHPGMRASRLRPARDGRGSRDRLPARPRTPSGGTPATFTQGRRQNFEASERRPRALQHRDIGLPPHAGSQPLVAPMALAGLAVDIVTCGSVKPSPRKRVMISVMLCTVMCARHCEVGADAVREQPLLDERDVEAEVHPPVARVEPRRDRRLARLRHELPLASSTPPGWR